MTELSLPQATAISAALTLWCAGAVYWLSPWPPLTRRSPRELTASLTFAAILTWLATDLAIGGVLLPIFLQFPDSNELVATMAAHVVSRLSAAAGLLWIAGRFDLQLRRLGVHPRHWRQHVRFGLRQSLFWGPLTMAVNLLARAAFGQDTPHPLQSMLAKSSNPGVWMIAAAAAVAAAPLLEELLFRGYIQTALTRVVEPWMAILLTSSAFAAVHWQTWPDPVPIAALGVGLGYVFQATRSLAAPVAMHAAFNAVNLAIASFAAR